MRGTTTKKQVLAVVGVLAIAGCSIRSPVTEAGNGTYLVSVKSSLASGGVAGARRRTLEDAEKFCAAQGDSLHAVIVDQHSRIDAKGYSLKTASILGVSDLRFRCDRTQESGGTRPTAEGEQ